MHIAVNPNTTDRWRGLVTVRYATNGPTSTSGVRTKVCTTLVPASSATKMKSGRWHAKNTSAIRFTRARYWRSKSEISGGSTRYERSFFIGGSSSRTSIATDRWLPAPGC